ncbi:maleylpyruvate isomerase family mycothiol-dependent enzyme (plasmid) [Embleya sp. NBC_00888]|uniref:maleylpyruvate isomerase family mycothiol-dependent enzyme n=1 Tax=Embleya sp. NBC_00888 TaxID=2975960 RepID=UPI002F90BEE3|nr:maleylpyruvate isomerase family mycothiol-dependent enzyme [Embleya sp. NBC_00888]
MDRISHLRREVRAFEAAARRCLEGGDAPVVPSCPEWTMSDLVVHLGGVHRFVTRVVDARLGEPPDVSDVGIFALPEDRAGWPDPAGPTPTWGPLAPGLVDWFAAGAGELARAFARTAAEERVWTWSDEQTVGFWLRVQTIEAAVHRWDAENTVGAAAPMDAELAADAVGQHFEVMIPARRARVAAAAGSGERLRLRRIDGPGVWAARFAGDRVLLGDTDRPCDVELAGTASDLMLFVWGRLAADRLEVTGDRDVLDRYSTLVPSV